MTSQEVTASRGDDPKETLKAQVQAEIAAAVDKKMALQVAVTPPPAAYEWNVWAFGPYQTPGHQPGRILKLGQKAYIATVVWMNQAMFENVEAFEADILLNFWTSNTQTMQPVRELSVEVCVEPQDPGRGGSFSVFIWEFTPTEAACVLETNICARLCNCEDHVVPGYAGFVRWVRNFDPELLWPTPRVEFDRPIRYMVYDPNAGCKCPPTI